MQVKPAEFPAGCAPRSAIAEKRRHGIGCLQQMIDVRIMLQGGVAKAARCDDDRDRRIGLLEGRVDRRAVNAAAERHLVLQDKDGAGGSFACVGG